MKCTTCQQTDFKNIQGRVFCANCGTDAAKRLRSFEPTASIDHNRYQPSQNNVLDLSQRNQAVASAADTASDQQRQPVAMEQQPSAAGSLGGLSPGTPNNNGPDWHAESNQTEPTSQFQAMNNPDGSAVQTTVMQPHQTYPVKAGAANDVAPEYPQTPEFTPIEGTSEESQNQKPERSKGKVASMFSGRLWRGAVAALCMVVLAGYITYLNYPNIAVKVAANRADIDAAIPGYLPGGYDFSGPVAYGSGQLTINFQAGEDQNITLSQSKSKWDSSSLLENYVQRQTSTYDTFHENGLTIYTFDGRYAAWVNGGMMYRIESDRELDVDEIVKMASSL